MGRHGLALLVGLVALVLVACGGDDDTSVADLQGTWSTESSVPSAPTTITLADCAVGEECGRLELGTDDRGERCVYTLTFTAQDRGGFEFETGGGRTFGCAWSGWSGSVVSLTPLTDDTIELVLTGPPHSSLTLAHVEP